MCVCVYIFSDVTEYLKFTLQLSSKYLQLYKNYFSNV